MSVLPAPVVSSWTTLEEGRMGILALISPLSEASLTTAPSTESWCILEVIEHLRRVESQVLKSILKSSPGATMSILDMVKYWLLVLAMDLPYRFKAPRSTVPKEIPLSLSQLTEEWSAGRKEWIAYLRAAPTSAMENKVFSHPRAGGMTLPRTLIWLGRHQRRHHRQIKRLISFIQSSDT